MFTINAQATFLEMLGRGIQPNSAAYSHLIAAYRHAAWVPDDYAEAVLDLMDRSRQAVDPALARGGGGGGAGKAREGEAATARMGDGGYRAMDDVGSGGISLVVYKAAINALQHRG